MSEEPESTQRELETIERVDPAIIGGAMAMLGPPLAVVTDHLLNQPDDPPPPQVELPPGVHVDDH